MPTTSRTPPPTSFPIVRARHAKGEADKFNSTSNENPAEGGAPHALAPSAQYWLNQGGTAALIVRWGVRERRQDCDRPGLPGQEDSG